MPEFSVGSIQFSGFSFQVSEGGWRRPGEVGFALHGPGTKASKESTLNLCGWPASATILTMILDKIPALRELSCMEKLELVDELWSDVRADASFDVRHEEIVAELERRRAEYASSPDSVVSWHDIKRRLAV